MVAESADIIMEGSIGTLLMKHFEKQDDARLWLLTGHINFGGAIPLDLISAGKAEKVILFLESSLAGF